ncbi:unnamed protein product [Urochloa humidicola]
MGPTSSLPPRLRRGQPLDKPDTTAAATHCRTAAVAGSGRWKKGGNVASAGEESERPEGSTRRKAGPRRRPAPEPSPPPPPSARAVAVAEEAPFDGDRRAPARDGDQRGGGLGPELLRQPARAGVWKSRNSTRQRRSPLDGGWRPAAGHAGRARRCVERSWPADRARVGPMAPPAANRGAGRREKLRRLQIEHKEMC